MSASSGKRTLILMCDPERGVLVEYQDYGSSAEPQFDYSEVAHTGVWPEIHDTNGTASGSILWRLLAHQRNRICLPVSEVRSSLATAENIGPPQLSRRSSLAVSRTGQPPS